MNISLRTSRLALAAALLGAALACAGCNLVAGTYVLVNGDGSEGSKEVDADYRGLRGKSFAVMVTASPTLQSSHPALVAKVTETVTAELAKHGEASGFVPDVQIITYQYNRPSWIARPMGEVASDLGAQRIVFIDIDDYRLRDPGNQYVWEGVADALVAVYECDSTTPDDMVYQKRIRVMFPDTKGVTPAELDEIAVNSALTRRLCDRAAWLFYHHEELNAIKY